MVRETSCTQATGQNWSVAYPQSQESAHNDLQQSRASLASLPPELRIEIVQHLKESIAKEALTPSIARSALRRQGLAVALVAREWREHGTRMSWERFGIDDDSGEGKRNVEHTEEYRQLASRYITRLDLSLLDVSSAEGSAASPKAFSRFCLSPFSDLHSLNELHLSFGTEMDLQIVLIGIRTSKLPKLRRLALSFDDRWSYSNFRLRYDPHACSTLLIALRTLTSIEWLKISLRTPSDANPPSERDLPLESVIEAPLSKLKHLELDLAAELDRGPNPPRSPIELEDRLIYLLSLPSPKILRSLLISATSVSSDTISIISTFTCLRTLSLRLEPDVLANIFDLLPPLLLNLQNLETFSITTNHTIERFHQIRPTPLQLSRFLDSLPPSLIVLVTHFDLTASEYHIIATEFLESRTRFPLTHWAYYDSSMEHNSLQHRPSSNYEFVLLQRSKNSARDSGAARWDSRPVHFVLQDGLRHR